MILSAIETSLQEVALLPTPPQRTTIMEALASLREEEEENSLKARLKLIKARHEKMIAAARAHETLTKPEDAHKISPKYLKDIAKRQKEDQERKELMARLHPKEKVSLYGKEHNTPGIDFSKVHEHPNLSKHSEPVLNIIRKHIDRTSKDALGASQNADEQVHKYYRGTKTKERAHPWELSSAHAHAHYAAKSAARMHTIAARYHTSTNEPKAAEHHKEFASKFHKLADYHHAKIDKYLSKGGYKHPHVKREQDSYADSDEPKVLRGKTQVKLPEPEPHFKEKPVHLIHPTGETYHQALKGAIQLGIKAHQTRNETDISSAIQQHQHAHNLAQKANMSSTVTQYHHHAIAGLIEKRKPIETPKSSIRGTTTFASPYKMRGYSGKPLGEELTETKLGQEFAIEKQSALQNAKTLSKVANSYTSLAHSTKKTKDHQLAKGAHEVAHVRWKDYLDHSTVAGDESGVRIAKGMMRHHTKHAANHSVFIPYDYEEATTQLHQLHELIVVAKRQGIGKISDIVSRFFQKSPGRQYHAAAANAHDLTAKAHNTGKDKHIKAAANAHLHAKKLAIAAGMHHAVEHHRSEAGKILSHGLLGASGRKFNFATMPARNAGRRQEPEGARRIQTSTSGRNAPPSRGPSGRLRVDKPGPQIAPPPPTTVPSGRMMASTSGRKGSRSDIKPKTSTSRRATGYSGRAQRPSFASHLTAHMQRIQSQQPGQVKGKRPKKVKVERFKQSPYSSYGLKAGLQHNPALQEIASKYDARYEHLFNIAQAISARADKQNVPNLHRVAHAMHFHAGAAVASLPDDYVGKKGMTKNQLSMLHSAKRKWHHYSAEKLGYQKMGLNLLAKDIPGISKT